MNAAVNRASGRLIEHATMSMELLRQLAFCEVFPVLVKDETSVDHLRVLRAAGMVEAQLPDEPGHPAWVHGVTGVGRAMLRADDARKVLELRGSRQMAAHRALTR